MASVLQAFRLRVLKAFNDIAVLALLRKEPLSGYTLTKQILKRFDVLLSSGTVYSTLYALERDGLVVGRVEGRNRIFSLTDQGREYIEALLAFSKEPDVAGLIDFLCKE